MKKLSILIAVLVLAVAFSAVSHAFSPGKSQFPVLSVFDLKAEIDSGGKLFIVDVRSLDEYRKGHLPGSVNVPPDGSISLTGTLPEDKNFPIVFYCRGWG